MVVTPFTLIALTRRTMPDFSLEAALQIGAVAAALALIFGLAEEQQFQLFYLLFLPIVWMAVRTGLEGVSVGILLTQLGLIAGVELFRNDPQDLMAFQVLMLILSGTGLCRRRARLAEPPCGTAASAAPGIARAGGAARQSWRDGSRRRA